MDLCMLAGGIGSGAPETGICEIEHKYIIYLFQKIIEKQIITQQDSSSKLVVS